MCGIIIIFEFQVNPSITATWADDKLAKMPLDVGSLNGTYDLTLHDLGLEFSHNVLGELGGIDMPNSAALRAAVFH